MKSHFLAKVGYTNPNSNHNNDKTHMQAVANTNNNMNGRDVGREESSPDTTTASPEPLSNEQQEDTVFKQFSNAADTVVELVEKLSGEAPPNNGKEKISNNKFEMKDVHTLPASKRGIKHSIAMKLRVRSKTILLECKYDMEDPLVEFCINGIDFTQLKHGNTIPLSELLDKSSGASSVNDGIEPANLNSAQSDFQNIDMNRKDSLRGLSNEYFIQIGKILVKGSSKFDDNGSLYGILVYPSAVIKKIDISRIRLQLSLLNQWYVRG